ncbi:MAG TPA: hypothetical protein V6D08_02765 [Candidatus Obscuribacterales bacterium]
MADGRNIEKQEAKQGQPESSSSVWSDVAREVVLGAVLGVPGVVASKLIEEKDKSAAEVAQDLGRAAAEAAISLVTLGAGGAAMRGAIKGATAAMKAGEKAGEGSSDKADGKQEQSTADKFFNFYKEVHGEVMPWFLLGPVALVPQVRESIKSTDGLVLDKIRSVSEDLFSSAKKNPLRFAAMSVASPLLPVLDAIINKEDKEKK